jgi:hypothetical protein
MRLYSLFLTCSLIFLANCGHGPKLNLCESDVANSRLDCSLSGAKPTSIPYAQSEGYLFYPGTSLQAVYDYCSARAEVTTQAPTLERCVGHAVSGTLTCAEVDCQLITDGDGVTCTLAPTRGMAYSATDKDFALSPSDEKTLLDYCNVKLQGDPQAL